MIWDLLWLALGLVLLIKGADWLVAGAATLARRLGVSDLTIGLTVVAFGTSMPEMLVSVVAAVERRGGIAVGNVLGSNIANILLILGAAGAIYPLAVTRRTKHVEIPLCILVGALLAILGADPLLGSSPHPVLDRADGLVLLCFFLVFMWYVAAVAREPGSNVIDEVPADTAMPGWRAVLLVAAGLAALVLGGRWTVVAAVGMAARLGVSEEVIGLTVVAVGTSLPELATSVVAAWRKNADIAIGNVVGSNIFNVFFILGAAAVVRPLPLAPGAAVDIGMVIASAVLLFLAMFTGKRRVLDRWEAIGFLALYVGYVVYLAVGR